MIKRTSTLAAAALLATTSLASAGEKAVSSVYINATWKYASGALGSARNSADNFQSIGCTVRSTAGSSTYVSCAARDASFKGAWCVSYDPKLVEMALSISGDSALQFYWNDDGSCSQLAVTNISTSEPKKP